MGSIIFGVVLIILGIFWLLYQLKNPQKPNTPMNWTTNMQSVSGSILLIFVGLMFAFKMVSLSYWFH